MFVFYGAVRGAPAVTPFPQVLRITMPSQESGNGPVNNHGILVWAGTGEGIRSGVFETGEWEVTFTRGELNKSSYGGTDTTTNTVTAVINRASGTVRFVYLNKGYVAEGVNAYMQESHRFADGDQVEFVPPELFGSETGFTDPPEGAYIEALELTEAGGGELICPKSMKSW